MTKLLSELTFRRYLVSSEFDKLTGSRAIRWPLKVPHFGARFSHSDSKVGGLRAWKSFEYFAPQNPVGNVASALCLKNRSCKLDLILWLPS